MDRSTIPGFQQTEPAANACSNAASVAAWRPNSNQCLYLARLTIIRQTPFGSRTMWASTFVFIASMPNPGYNDTFCTFRLAHAWHNYGMRGNTIRVQNCRSFRCTVDRQRANGGNSYISVPYLFFYSAVFFGRFLCHKLLYGHILISVGKRVNFVPSFRGHIRANGLRTRPNVIFHAVFFLAHFLQIWVEIISFDAW